MARTFTPLTGTGASNAYQLNDKWGFQTAEKVRQALDVANYNGGCYPLGGIELPMTVASGGTYEPALNAITWDLDGDNFGGMTLQVVFFNYTSSAGTSVTSRLRNTTDSTTAAQGAASTATTRGTSEVVTVTLASGVKTYQLQWTASNTTNPVYVWAVLRFRKVPA